MTKTKKQFVYVLVAKDTNKLLLDRVSDDIDDLIKEAKYLHDEYMEVFTIQKFELKPVGKNEK